MLLNDKLDATQVCQICFPAILAATASRGAYIVPSPSQVKQVLEQGDFPYEDKIASAWLRLDIACTYLWPYVEELFTINLFPSLLAAVLDILRATEFCETDDPIVQRLATELAESLDALEQVLSSNADQQALAAEPGK